MATENNGIRLDTGVGAKAVISDVRALQLEGDYCGTDQALSMVLCFSGSAEYSKDNFSLLGGLSNRFLWKEWKAASIYWNFVLKGGESFAKYGGSKMLIRPETGAGLALPVGAETVMLDLNVAASFAKAENFDVVPALLFGATFFF